MVCYHSAGVAPSHLVGPAMESGVCATFVEFQPAGVEVFHKNYILILIFVILFNLFLILYFNIDLNYLIQFIFNFIF